MKHISDPKAANVNIPAQTPNGRIWLGLVMEDILDMNSIQILFDTVSVNFTDGIEDVANHLIKPAVAGYYEFHASLYLQNVKDATRYDLHVCRSPGDVVIAEDMKVAGSNANMTLNVSDVCYLTALQSLDVHIYHYDATHSLHIGQVESGSFLTVQRVR